jgi:UTP--glucose-1-phosphate uridylyltransferase
MVVGHQKAPLMDYLGTGENYGVNLAYVWQMKRYGIGHAILQGQKWIDDTFVVLLGDSFVSPREEVKKLLDIHSAGQWKYIGWDKLMSNVYAEVKYPIATVMLFEVSDPTGYGLAKLEKNHTISSVIEKPNKYQAQKYKRKNGKYLAMCGLYVFEPKMFEFIKRTKPGRNNEIQITDAIKLAIRCKKLVFGHILKGTYYDIGKWHTTLNVEDKLRKSFVMDERIKEMEDLAEMSV